MWLPTPPLTRSLTACSRPRKMGRKPTAASSPSISLTPWSPRNPSKHLQFQRIRMLRSGSRHSSYWFWSQSRRQTWHLKTSIQMSGPLCTQIEWRLMLISLESSRSSSSSSAHCSRELTATLGRSRQLTSEYWRIKLCLFRYNWRNQTT